MMTLNVEREDRYKVFFTSDTHWGHYGICKFCNRPFESRQEMDDALINNWNSVVPEDGIVVHCGDFMLPHEEDYKKYEKLFKRLNFKTLLLLRGNHDRIQCGDYDVDGRTVIVRDVAIININGTKICAMHYPLLAYNGVYNVYGHVHTLSNGIIEGTDAYIMEHLQHNQYDVGVDQNNYTPVSFLQLMKIFNKRKKEYGEQENK